MPPEGRERLHAVLSASLEVQATLHAVMRVVVFLIGVVLTVIYAMKYWF